MDKKMGASDQTHMYHSLKRTNGTYSLAGYLKRGAKLTGIPELKKYFNRRMPDAGILRRIGISLDYYGALIRYGATVSDYFEYEFWKKRACFRKEYITKLYHRKIQKRHNIGSTEPLSNKLLFNEVFKEFRAGIRGFTFDRSEDEFLAFVRECDRDIIAKPFTGFSGQGIYLPDVSTDEEARKVYAKLKADGNYFVEKVFHQKGVLHEIHPYAVNTVRVLSLNDGQQVHHMYAYARFGGSERPVDNNHSGGMSCEVDLDSGRIISVARNLNGDRFVRHPMSGKFFPGTQIPNWPAVKELVVKAAQKLPEVGYIGWDIAISDDGICLIEGNECANVDGAQVSGQRGLKALYEPYMK